MASMEARRCDEFPAYYDAVAGGHDNLADQLMVGGVMCQCRACGTPLAKPSLG